MSEQIQTQVYKAKEEEKKAVSFIWILPIIIAFILVWVAYESYSKKGTNIVVVFKSAEGLKEGVTTLEYKGLHLGKVTKIDMYDDFKNVKVNILVRSEAAPYVTSESSRFWIKKPTVSLTKISGLSTLISGYKIELSPKFKTQEEYDKGKTQYIFKGYDSKPDDDLIDSGYYISLLANDDENVQIGTPIFYNKFQVGEVVSKEFKYEKVFIKAYIYDKFNYLINKSSKFYMNDALRVSYGASGLKIELGSLYSALVGGITVTTPQKEEAKISKDEVYILYVSKEELKKREYFNINFLDAKGITKDTPIIYKGITIGKLSKLHLRKSDILAKAYVYDKYKYLLSENSKFFIQKPELNFSGAKNLSNIIKGNYISLVYKKGQIIKNFYAKDYEDLIKEKTNVIYTLYANNLNSISSKSKVYYKNFVIGKVISTSLTRDLKRVKVKISIDKKYKKLINNHSLFYDMSSKIIEAKKLKLNINYQGINPLVNGAIGLISPKEKAKTNMNSFKLYESYSLIEKLIRTYDKGFYLDVKYDNSFKIHKDMLLVYKNQKIGFIKNINFNDRESKVRFFVYDKYKKFISEHSRFYKKSLVSVKASLNGLFFEIDNFTSFLEGSIHLDNSSKQKLEEKRVYSSKDDMLNSFQSITIFFDNVEGLHEEFSQLLYKGAKIGKVTKISLEENNKILVKAQIYKNYEEFSKKGTVFYLKKPKITLQEVSNLGSTVLAVNIAVIKSKLKAKQKVFEGHDSFPSLANSHKGKIYKVESLFALKAKPSSPIYYKNVKIGKINKLDLTNDGSKVIIDCLIFEKYDKLIRKNSKFYDISGFNMKFSLFSGSKVEANTFNSIIKGALVVVTPKEYGEKAVSGDKFLLIDDLPQDWDKISPMIK